MLRELNWEVGNTLRFPVALDWRIRIKSGVDLAALGAGCVGVCFEEWVCTLGTKSGPVAKVGAHLGEGELDEE